MAYNIASKYGMCDPPPGASLRMCHALGQHIMALEADSAILKTMLEVLEDSITNTMSKEQP